MPPEFDHLLQQLVEQGWAFDPEFLTPAQVRELAEIGRRRHGLGEFKAAGIGGRAAHNPSIRGDSIFWLEPEPGPIGCLLECFERLRQATNRTCQLGLFDLEAHFAIYPPGQGYARHVDQIRGDDTRQLSIVCYLNETWTEDDGGELRLYLPDGQHQDIRPQGGCLVMFLAAKFPHEVLPAKQQRLSVTGWFKRRPY